MAALLVATTVVAGCASGYPQIYKGRGVPDKLELQRSKTHDFSSIDLYYEINTFRLTGYVLHEHEACVVEGHVDLVIYNSKKEVVESQSLKIRKRHGVRGRWQNAEFRAEIPERLPKDALIRLALHGDECSPRLGTECSANAALVEKN